MNDLYGRGNVPLLDGPEKFRSSSMSHIYDNTVASSSSSTAVNNGVTNNGVYGNDGDFISSHCVPGASSRGSSGDSLRNGGGGGCGGSN